MSKNPIIVFEGIEGSGKSHHINKVSKYLDKKKINYIKIREPGGSLNSEKIRRLILNKKSNFNIYTDLLLYLAARSENINLIKKSYKKKIILIDRFTDSTIAYQHYGMKLDINIIRKINNYLIGKFKADLTFLSLVNKNNMKKRLRIRKKNNKYDKFKNSFYERVQKGFLKISNKNKSYVILDSNKNNLNQTKEILINKIKKII